MTKDTKRKTHAEAEAGHTAHHAAATNGEGNGNAVDFAPWLKASETMFNGMMTIGQEVGEFAANRLRENMEFTSSVMQCGDPREAVRLEMDYARQATQQYLDEASKLMQMTAQVSQKGWASIETATRENLKRLEQ
jgi:hypothetical protein